MEKKLNVVKDRFEPRFLVCGDTGITVELGDRIDPKINQRVHDLFGCLKAKQRPGILSLNPTYRSLFIQYDPWRCSHESLLLLVEECLAETSGMNAAATSVVEIPVCYGGELGPDLTFVAEYHGLSSDEVIGIHSAPLYHVYMIGFTPGYPYMGGLDERLFTPRRKEPRQKVPACSVAIADRQAGIYSIESPGGWHLLGRTPVKLFDLQRPEPFYLKPGDTVRFKPITRDEFEGYQNR